MQFFDTDYNFSTIIPSLPKDKHKKILSKEEKHKKNSVLPFIGKYFWNDLPLSIRNITSKILFYFAH